MGHSEKSDFLFLKTKSGERENTLTTYIESNLGIGLFVSQSCSPFFILRKE